MAAPQRTEGAAQQPRPGARAAAAPRSGAMSLRTNGGEAILPVRTRRDRLFSTAAGRRSIRRADEREPLTAISANAGRGIRSAAAATIPNVNASSEKRLIRISAYHVSAAAA